MIITTSFGQQLEVTETPNGLLVYRREVDLDDGSISSESWFRDGKMHRDNGPSRISYYDLAKVFPNDPRTFEELARDGKVQKAQWHRFGRLHREDGPASTQHRDDGSIEKEVWYRDGKQHRDDGPAFIEYHFLSSYQRHVLEMRPSARSTSLLRTPDGSITREVWFRDGLRHRDDGPAVIYYYGGGVYPGDTRTFEELERDGAVSSAGWLLDGKKVPRFT